MLALEGIPAIYIQSLIGARNDLTRMEHTGRFRSINRHLWQYSELEARLTDPDSENSYVYERLMTLIEIRRNQPAFQVRSGTLSCQCHADNNDSICS